MQLKQPHIHKLDHQSHRLSALMLPRIEYGCRVGHVSKCRVRPVFNDLLNFEVLERGVPLSGSDTGTPCIMKGLGNVGQPQASGTFSLPDATIIPSAKTNLSISLTTDLSISHHEFSRSSLAVCSLPLLGLLAPTPSF